MEFLRLMENPPLLFRKERFVLRGTFRGIFKRKASQKNRHKKIPPRYIMRRG